MGRVSNGRELHAAFRPSERVDGAEPGSDVFFLADLNELTWRELGDTCDELLAGLCCAPLFPVLDTRPDLKHGVQGVVDEKLLPRRTSRLVVSILANVPFPLSGRNRRL